MIKKIKNTRKKGVVFPGDGRPTKLTQEVQNRICGALQRSSFVEVAVRLAGISKDTFYDWIARANKGEKEYVEFRDAIEIAQAQGEMRLLNFIDKAIEGGEAKLALEILARKYPKRWGSKAAIRIEDEKTEDEKSFFKEESLNKIIVDKLQEREATVKEYIKSKKK